MTKTGILRYGPGVGLSYGLGIGPGYYGLSYGLIGLLISLTLSMQPERVQLAERLRWSWSSLGKHLFLRRHVRTSLLLTLLLVLLTGLSLGVYA